MKIQKQAERSHRQLKSQKTGEEFSLSSVISEALSLDGVFISHEIIRPDSRSSSPHYHSHSDEMVYILKGELVVVEGNSSLIVSEGDSIVFERQSGLYHFLKNESATDAHVLLIRKKLSSQDVVYPDTN